VNIILPTRDCSATHVGKWHQYAAGFCAQSVIATEAPSTLSKEAKLRFPCPAQSQGIVPVHIVRVQLPLHCLPDERFHIAGYSREDPGVLEFSNMVMV